MGKINDIKHNNGSKMYPQSRYFRLFYAKYKCLRIILIWSLFLISSSGLKKVGIGKKGGYFQLVMGPGFNPWRKAENPQPILSPLALLDTSAWMFEVRYWACAKVPKSYMLAHMVRS